MLHGPYFKIINHPLIWKMSSSHFTFFIYLLTFALSPNHFWSQPLFHFCLSSAGNFITNDPYGSNLKTLLGNLHYQTPPQGYGLSSVGSNSNQTYGLALCRGDVNATACKLVLLRPEMNFTNVAHITKVQLYGMIIVFWSTWTQTFFTKLIIKTSSSCGTWKTLAIRQHLTTKQRSCWAN